MVPVACGAVDNLELAEVAPEPVDLCFDILVGHDRAGHGHPQAAVAHEVDLRPHFDHRVEGDGTRLLAGGDVDLRGCDDIDIIVSHRLRVVDGQRVTKRLDPARLLAEPCLEDATRSLAGAETGYPNLPGDLAEGGVNILLELLLVDLDRQLDLVAFQRLDRGFHNGHRV